MTTANVHNPTRRLTDRDIAALFGVSKQTRMWGIHQELAGRLEPPKTDDLARAARRAWIQMWIDGGYLPNASVREPHNEVEHPDLPLTVRPDIIIESAPTVGEGPGAATLATVTPREWNRDWNRPGEGPKPPAHEMMRLQTILMTVNVGWGAVVPAVGTSGFRSPIYVASDTDLQNEIARMITDTWQRVTTGQPPAPDARADEKALAALARALAGRTLRDPSEAERDEIQKTLAELDGVEQEIAREREGMQPLLLRRNALRKELETQLAEFGAVTLPQERVALRTISRRALPASAERIEIQREPLGAT